MASCRARSNRAGRGTDGPAAVAATCGSEAVGRFLRALRIPAATANPRATNREVNRNSKCCRRCLILLVDPIPVARMAVDCRVDQMAERRDATEAECHHSPNHRVSSLKLTPLSRIGMVKGLSPTWE